MIQCNLNFEYRISKNPNEQCNICRSWSKPVSNAMVRVFPYSFHTNSSTRLNLIHLKTSYDYKEIRIPQKDDILCCKKDCPSEALAKDKHAVCIYKKDRLVGHVPIELSQIILSSRE